MVSSGCLLFMKAFDFERFRLWESDYGKILRSRAPSCMCIRWWLIDANQQYDLGLRKEYEYSWIMRIWIIWIWIPSIFIFAIFMNIWIIHIMSQHILPYRMKLLNVIYVCDPLQLCRRRTTAIVSLYLIHAPSCRRRYLWYNWDLRTRLISSQTLQTARINTIHNSTTECTNEV